MCAFRLCVYTLLYTINTRRDNPKVVRVEKLKPNLPKLNIVPANAAMDPRDCIVQRRPRDVIKMLTPSPSPSPVPPEDFDPDFDPDNVVIRGAPSDDEDDDDDDDDDGRLRAKDATGGNGLNDFTFDTHS